MEAVFLRILSFVLSVLMFFFNTLSAIFPGVMPEEPIENAAAVYDASLFELEENAVVSDYVSWLEIGGNSEKYDWKYFFTRSLALVKVDLPDSGCSIEIDSVKENGDILEIEYRIVREEGEYPDEEIGKIILIETSKNISLINATEIKETSDNPDVPDVPDVPDNPEEPEQEEISYGLFSSENFNDKFIYNKSWEVVKDYESWRGYYIGTDSALEKYDEKYFEEKSIAVLYIEVPADGKTVEIISIENSSDSKSIDVQFRVKNGESDYTKGCWAVVAEVGKEVSYVFPFEIGIKGESKLIDAERFNSDYMPLREDGRYKIVSSLSAFESVQNDKFMIEYSFTNEFFEDSSLALIYVMLPNYNYDVKVNSQTENGNTLEIEYTTSVGDYVYESYESVKYLVIAAEISKNITEVNAVETSFKNSYRSFYTSKFSGLTDEPMLVSDYETWTAVNKSSSDYLGRYDEEYFENGSLVLVSETMPDTGANFDVVKLKEKGKTLELVYGINGPGGLTVLEFKTLVIEVSKAVETVSSERKDIDNYSKSYPSYYFTTKGVAEGEPVLISSYYDWYECVNGNPESVSRYDAEFFKYNSLVLINVALPSSACEMIVRYASEENGTFDAGICKHEYYGVGGLTVMVYKTVVIEVSKDVTQVNAEIFE